MFYVMRTLRLASIALLCGACAPHREPPIAAPAPMVIGVQLPRVVTDSLPTVRTRSLALRADPDTVPVPAEVILEAAEGEATYYAAKFDGRRTASGIVFWNTEAYAAHRTYPFGTVVRVTNTRNERSVILRVVDRGPHGTSERQRRTIIDVSHSAAQELGFVQAGRVPVRVEVLEWGARR
jgi:rare lipoprotein A